MSRYDYMDKEVLKGLLYERDRKNESLEEEINSLNRQKYELIDEVNRLKPYEQRARNAYDNWITNAERGLDETDDGDISYFDGDSSYYLRNNKGDIYFCKDGTIDCGGCGILAENRTYEQMLAIMKALQ